MLAEDAIKAAVKDYKQKHNLWKSESQQSIEHYFSPK